MSVVPRTAARPIAVISRLLLAFAPGSLAFRPLQSLAMNVTSSSGGIPIYGRFCGPQWCCGIKQGESDCHAFECGAPVDDIDACCQAHDDCCPDSGGQGCNCQLLQCFENLPWQQKVKPIWFILYHSMYLNTKWDWFCQNGGPECDAHVQTGEVPVLKRGQNLHPNGQDVCFIVEENKVMVCFQTDGNLVVYKTERTGRSVIWSAGSGGHPGASLEFQGDGNLVIYGDGHASVWASGTSGSDAQSLVLGADCNLVLYDGNRKALWSSSNFCKF